MRFSSIAALSFVLSGALVPNIARAQDPADVLAQQVQVVYGKTFEALPQLMDASAKLMEARGAKDEAQRLRAAAEDARKGATKPDKDLLEAAIKSVSASAEALADTNSVKAAAMTAEQKELFKEGAVAYFMGTKATVQLGMALTPLTQAISGIGGIRNPMALRRLFGTLGVARALAQGVPQVTKSNLTAASALRNYIKSNDIQIDASLMEW